VSGERAEESPARAKYKTIQVHKTTTKTRTTIQWRPVHDWEEHQVWTVIRKHKINPHPAYRLGWGRLSCMKCIFGSIHQWASIKKIDRAGFDKIADYEQDFGKTIHRQNTVNQQAALGMPYDNCSNQDLVEKAKAMVFDEPMIQDTWEVPAGAFGESNGPI